MNFIFLRVMEVWMQWGMCKVSDDVNFARDSLRSYFHDSQKNEIYFLSVLLGYCKTFIDFIAKVFIVIFKAATFGRLVSW